MEHTPEVQYTAGVHPSFRLRTMHLVPVSDEPIVGSEVEALCGANIIVRRAPIAKRHVLGDMTTTPPLYPNLDVCRRCARKARWL